MLKSIDLNDQSYEEMLAEAIASIPVYSKEWTNFNASDPGITILENLTAFHLLQQTYINEESDSAKSAMLKLLGYTAKENKAARLLLQAPREGATLPEHCQFRAGSLCFEVMKPLQLDAWSIGAVYAAEEDNLKDITYLLNLNVESYTTVFDINPEQGKSICCILRGIPPTNTELLFWAQIPEDGTRNPFPQEDGPVFADTTWQYYTSQGWQDAQAQDQTHGFLVSGEIRLRLTAGEPTLFSQAPVQGCAIRCLLTRAAYDRAPRLASLSANLFQTEQRETLAKSFLFFGNTEIVAKSALAAKGNIFVYCKEADGQRYRPYTAYAGVNAHGRIYHMELLPNGVRIGFDKERFGYGPQREQDAVLLVCYDDEMVHHRKLGEVYGYEEQQIPIDLPMQPLPQEFAVLAEITNDQGELEYDMVTPNRTNPDQLCYTVLSQASALLIQHPGLGQSYHLILCDCAVTQGEKGNIRQHNHLTCVLQTATGSTELTIANPAMGIGGQSAENTEDLRRRFAAEMRTVSTAVLPSDYETLAKGTPGLCIHKVNAIADPQKNKVQLVVKPYDDKKFPTLSTAYWNQITAHLDKKRMITTKIELIQPKYVAIDVFADIYVKTRSTNDKVQIEEILRTYLNHVDSVADFGGWVRCSDVYRLLLSVSGVELVENLRLVPVGTDGADLVETDIRLQEESLCYCGNAHLEIYFSALY